MAGEPGFAQMATVAVYGAGDPGCRAVLRTRFPVQALAFHPTEPLLAVGTGEYDGGYHFEGELLLLDWETGAARSLIEGDFGRQVLGLTWLDGQDLRVLMAPYDDYKDRKAHVEGHTAVVRRPDWRTVAPRSLTPVDLAGPRVPAPRPDGRDEARTALSALSPHWEPRRQVLAVEELPGGGLLAILHEEEDAPERPVPGDREDGLLVRYRTTAYVERLDRLRIRRGSRDYVRQSARVRRGPKQDWLAACSPKGSGTQPLFPLSWESGQTHFPGPGAETGDGDLVYAGTVYDGRGLQPGGSFVVRRAAADGTPRWTFRTDHVATDLDTAADTAYLAYRNGELIALDLHDGTLRWRHQLTIAGTPAIPTALTAAEPGRLLVGTSDGRILDCAVV
ncbi:PQQ-like beta-propeller repeat protein [Kitasatospora purpeofusca]|uniref:outer membrane protein assembly factor BamB family protein n=1 Tax=Kitasatospora purpeofusca TaxID=67352 RepID=UPI002E15A55F|nr:PQQ-like beta-propeller repeat protein [Kitasatospora purpeofusca]